MPNLWHRAQQVIPGGVNSPVRAFRQVGGEPKFLARGSGARVWDEQGKSYIDFVGSWGPLILGHAAPVVLDAVAEAMQSGTSFGAPTKAEVEFAETLVDLIPGLEMVRLVSSGTEACLAAIRLARGFTGRKRIVKFNGCYHGHADSFLVAAGSGVATLGIAGSPGVPTEVAELTISLEYNDLNLVQQCFQKFGSEIAAVIVEPVAGNMGLVVPESGYLQGLRDLCSQYGAVLIFDEVMSGFRVDLRGAAGRFGITPDLYTLGKVIGGGLPLAAFGGSREIMQQLAPLGPIYQAGTLSGNPLAVAAGRAMIRELQRLNPYQELEVTGQLLVSELQSLAAKRGIGLQVGCCGTMIGFFFSDVAVRNFSDAKQSDIERFKKFFHLMLDRGVYLAPSAFEAGFLSTCHDRAIIAEVLNAAESSFKVL